MRFCTQPSATPPFSRADSLLTSRLCVNLDLAEGKVSCAAVLAKMRNFPIPRWHVLAHLKRGVVRGN
jgi:hypothetical protein